MSIFSCFLSRVRTQSQSSRYCVMRWMKIQPNRACANAQPIFFFFSQSLGRCLCEYRVFSFHSLHLNTLKRCCSFLFSLSLFLASKKAACNDIPIRTPTEFTPNADLKECFHCCLIYIYKKKSVFLPFFSLFGYCVQVFVLSFLLTD